MGLEEGVENPLNLDSTLLIVSANFKKAHRDVEAELTEDHRKLMKQQKMMEEKYQKLFLGLSLHDTIRELLILGDIKAADKLKSDHKMSDKHFWWLKIQVLSQQFQWEELEKFSKAKKSPIGMEPFVEICLKQRNFVEAKKYILRCRDDRKILWFNRAGLHEDAARLAFDLRDLNSLLNIHMQIANGNNRELVGKVESYMAQLSAKK
jgi:hypothetical protein